MEHVAHLSKDKRLGTLLEGRSPHVLAKRKKIYLQLCYSILSQQLSTRVAQVLRARFLALYGGKEPTAQQILDTPAAAFRAIGFSNAKAAYVHNVCRFFLEHGLTDARIHRMTNEEVFALLTQIKGVGKWTVEMILMFTLGREDIFSAGDLGLQQAVIKLYRLREKDRKALIEKIEKIAARWSPYRTYACLYLWGWKDGK